MTTETPSQNEPLPAAQNAQKELPRHHADTRSLYYVLVSAVAAAFALQWGAKFFIPLSLGIILTYTLNPVVIWLERRKVPRWLGATLVMVAVVCGAGFLAVSIEGQVETILTQLPESTHKLRNLLEGRSEGEPGIMQRLKDAQAVVEQAQTSPPAGAANRRGPQHVVVDDSGVHLNDLMWEGSRNVAGVAVQLVMVLFLVYFLLLSGDIFKRKLIRLTGTSLSSKKITVQILDDIDSSIQRYMLALFLTNLMLAALSWGLFTWAGLENAGAWAVAAGFLHVIPYFGPMLTAVLTGGAALLQSGSWTMVILASGGSLFIALVIGVLITTWMTGKLTRMNPAAIFVALLFWSALWGVWGALLAMPITGIIKVVSQRIEQFTPLAEFLGE